MLVRRICLALSWIALVLAGHGATQAQTWKKHTYATDGFEVEFSGDVRVMPTNLNEDTLKKIVRSTDYQQDGG
jgi:hypothetical protein